MKHLNLPVSAFVNRFIPKSKFFEKAKINSKLKQEFTDEIARITLQYILAEKSINISGTENIKELHIFHIALKQKKIPKNILRAIDRAMSYNIAILYIFEYEHNIAYGITTKEDSAQRYYFSDWNANIEFQFTGNTIEHIYQKIIKTFIQERSEISVENEDFIDIVKKDMQREKLFKEISSLENKIKNEKQFNKQIVLNQELLKKKRELEDTK